MVTSRKILLSALTICLSLAGIGVAGASGNVTAPAGTITVMSFNIYHDGHHGIDKIAGEIRESGADVVALQESRNDSAAAVAKELGWSDYTQSGYDVNIISKKKISRSWTGQLPGRDWGIAGALIDGIWIYSAHYSHSSYGPYSACFDGKPVADIVSGESARTAEAQGTVDLIDDPAPSILAGDLNTPSHLDWTSATKDAHCGYVADWPASKVITDAGYTDSYREVHPDPAGSPGNTWSPRVKENTSEAPGEPEPQDRIDHIYYKNGALDATASTRIGTGPSWPSDHSAVMTTFTY